MNPGLNTTAIGDDFEAKSLEIIKKVIEQEQLGLKEYLKIYTKKEKGYYSQLRQKEIFFELTIEFWPPGATRYVLLYIIECKSYSGSVPVNDIEEFHHKIMQVSGVNVKGIFMTNAPLQESAYKIAESTGMMLIQGRSSDDYQIVLYKEKKDQSINRLPFINNTFN